MIRKQDWKRTRRVKLKIDKRRKEKMKDKIKVKKEQRWK